MPPKKPFSWKLVSKMLAGGGAIAVGGPFLVWSVTPTDEQLFQRYSPELQKKSLEGRYERQKEYDDFVMKLRTQAKSDKNMWVVQEAENASAQAVAARKKWEAREQERSRVHAEQQAMKETMRKDSGLSR